MKQYKGYKTTILKNDKVREEYNLLESEFSIVKEFVKVRKKLHLSQQELAQRVSTKQSAISRFEKGLVNPSLLFLNKLSEALGKKLQMDLK